MNQIAKELREAADYMKREGVDLLGAVIRLNNTFDAINPGTPAANLGAIVAYIADELDELDDKATRRRSHIVKLESTIAERNRELRELRKQVPTERERRILDMWPRFEDGELVMPGDKVHYASAYNDETEIEVESITAMDGYFVLCDDECRSNQYEQGQRVKRPVQSVLDADGVEIKVGDTVYEPNGQSGIVTALHPSTRSVDLRQDGCDVYAMDTKRLTHTRPDSWERLEMDAELNDETGIVGGNLDIVRRAKALAGVEVD